AQTTEGAGLVGAVQVTDVILAAGVQDAQAVQEVALHHIGEGLDDLGWLSELRHGMQARAQQVHAVPGTDADFAYFGEDGHSFSHEKSHPKVAAALMTPRYLSVFRQPLLEISSAH